MTARPRLVAICLVLLVSAALAGSAAPSALAANTMALQPDGKILLSGRGFPGGYGAVVRYRADGSLDRSFAGRGVLIDHRFNPFTALALASDGGILLGARQGANWFDFGPLLGRYSPDGRPDPGFGSGGAAYAPREASGLEPKALLPNADGSFLVGLDHDAPAPDLSVALSASADLYGRDGGFLARVGSLPGGPGAEDGVSLSDLLPGADGPILAVGVRPLANPGPRSLFARMRPGSGLDYDHSFGAGAGLLEPFPAPGAANAIALDGPTVVVAGGTGSELALARFDAGGARVRAFGEDGIVHQAIPGASGAEAHAIAVAPDGQLLIAGALFRRVLARASVYETSEAFLARFDTDGSLDQGFGSGGVVRLPQFGDEARAENLAVLAGGKVLVRVGPDFDLAQLNADGSLDSAFGRGGVVSTETCPGPVARMHRLGCLPAARGGLWLRGSGARLPTIRLNARFDVPWARIQRVRLLLPPALRFRVRRSANLKTRLVSRLPSSHLTVRAYPGGVVFNQLKAKRLLATVPGTALRPLAGADLRGPLTFRVEIKYFSGPPETLVFHRPLPAAVPFPR